MKHFTESPYEEIMGQEPESREAPHPVPPPGDICSGCPFGRVRPCIGICMKELVRGLWGQRKGEQTL